jgi:outer membrane protein OmpA-like peptidoglycan-associated protein
MASKPDDKAVITGYASSSEADADNLAEKRAQAAKESLVSEYGMDISKIETKSEISEQSKFAAVAVLEQ